MTSSVVVSSEPSSVVDSSGDIGSGGVRLFYGPSDSGSSVISFGIPSSGGISVEPPVVFSDVSTSGSPSIVVGFDVSVSS